MASSFVDTTENTDLTIYSPYLSNMANVGNSPGNGLGKPVKIYMSSAVYKDLNNYYTELTSNEDNIDTGLLAGWRDSTAYSLFITADSESTEDDPECPFPNRDTGIYQIVACTSSGKPIPITLPYNQVDSTYFTSYKGKEGDGNGTTYTNNLSLNIQKIGDVISKDPGNPLNAKIDDLTLKYKNLALSYTNLEKTVDAALKRIANLETLMKDVIFRYPNNPVTYLWTGTYAQYKAVNPKRDDTLFSVRR